MTQVQSATTRVPPRCGNSRGRGRTLTGGIDMAERTCVIDGCPKPSKYETGLRWCSMHYARWLLHGSTDDPRPSFEDRVWSQVQKGPGCWKWTGSCTVHGYGQVQLGKKNMRAHRAVWELTNGPIPEGMHVLHSCDNPPCVNPAHLRLGTHADNMRDMVAKDRCYRGFLPDAERKERLQKAVAKMCPRCETVKAPAEFGPNAARKDHLQTYCAPCRRAYAKARR